MIPWADLLAAGCASVSVAVLVVLVHLGYLGRHVYDDLRQDIAERTRANGWEVAAVAITPAVPLSPPETPVPPDDDTVREAVAAVLAEARQESEQILAARLQQERVAADLRLHEAVSEAKAAAAAELARVRQTADETVAQALERARAEFAHQREAAVREAQVGADAELARVKQTADEAMALALERARDEFARQREAAVRETQTAADAKLALVKQTADEAMAQALERARGEFASQREAAARETQVAETATPPPAKKQTIEEHLKEARAQLARSRSAAR